MFSWTAFLTLSSKKRLHPEAVLSISHAIYLVSDTRQAVDFLSHLFGMRVLADETAITGERFLSMGTDDAQAVRLQIVEVDLLKRWWLTKNHMALWTLFSRLLTWQL